MNQILMGNDTYDAVMLSRSLSIPQQGTAIKNLEHGVKAAFLWKMWLFLPLYLSAGSSFLIQTSSLARTGTTLRS